MDDDEGSSNWIFDAVTKKSLMNRLFVNMSGSVVCQEDRSKGSNNRKRKASTSASTTTLAPKRKAKAKAKAKAAAGSTPTDQILAPEPDLNSTTVNCQKGVRQKVWLDDLMGCVNHVITGLEAKSCFSKISKDDFSGLKKELVRIGLVFAFKGQYLLPSTDGKAGKLHRKWSTLRPALQAYAVAQLVKA